MKKKVQNYMIAAAGIILICVGLLLIKMIAEPNAFMKVFPYICVGIGCGIFGQGMGNILSQRTFRKNPGLQRHIEIEQKDERNITIGNMAKAKAYNMMIYVFGALMIVFAVMGASLSVVLLFVAAYLFVISYGIYYRIKYDRNM